MTLGPKKQRPKNLWPKDSVSKSYSLCLPMYCYLRLLMPKKYCAMKQLIVPSLKGSARSFCFLHAPFSRGPATLLIGIRHFFLASFGILVKRGFFSGTQCQCMHISTKDLVYEHLPHSTLFTLSLFPIYPYIAYFAILGTKVCIHTICTLGMEEAPFPAVWGHFSGNCLLSTPLQSSSTVRTFFLSPRWGENITLQSYAHIRFRGYMSMLLFLTWGEIDFSASLIFTSSLQLQQL